MRGYITLPEYMKKWNLPRYAVMKLIKSGALDYVKPEGTKTYFIRDEKDVSGPSKEQVERLTIMVEKLLNHLGVKA